MFTLHFLEFIQALSQVSKTNRMVGCELDSSVPR